MGKTLPSPTPADGTPPMRPVPPDPGPGVPFKLWLVPFIPLPLPLPSPLPPPFPSINAPLTGGPEPPRLIMVSSLALKVLARGLGLLLQLKLRMSRPAAAWEELLLPITTAAAAAAEAVSRSW